MIEVSSIIMCTHFEIKPKQSERKGTLIEYITRQLNKYQEQEDLPRWFAAQMSVAKQINQPHLVDQKSPKSNLKGKHLRSDSLSKNNNNNMMLNLKSQR